jgi:hypothetical protein
MPLTKTLKVGDKLYKVVDDPAYDDGPDSWKVVSRIVTAVTAKTFKLNRPFPGVTGRIAPNKIGSVVHASAAQALAYFSAGKVDRIASAKRLIIESERAITWAARENQKVSSTRDILLEALRSSSKGLLNSELLEQVRMTAPVSARRAAEDVIWDLINEGLVILGPTSIMWVPRV